MLSNPTPQSNLHLRQRLHRRQNSTPTAFEAVKIEAQPNSPNLHQPRPRHGVSHRRGLSLDTRRQQLSPSTARTTVGQDFTTVSTTTTTNTKGLATHPQQVLRESQQQRAVRPGLRTPRNFDVQNTQDGENYLLSPQGTPHSQRFHSFVPQGANVPVSSQDFSDYLGKMNVDLKRQQFDFIANSASIGSESFGLFSSDSALSTPTYLTFADDLPSATSQQGWLSEGETTSTRRTSRRISNGILDRVAKFETMTMDAARPVTPPPQNAQGKFTDETRVSPSRVHPLSVNNRILTSMTL
jgi:regulatory protein SWI5